ncbi:hypothetical protein ABFS82_08G152400 [Erythranthe guttata]
MEGGGGGGGNSNSCMMAFGGNNDGFCPMLMMPPHNNHHHTTDGRNNNLFLPLIPSSSNHHHGGGGGGGGGSSMMLEEHHNNGGGGNNNITSTGYYFMESNNNNNNDDGINGGGGGCSTKDKIMAHPHYHRLLSAYANCQKIGAPPEVVVKLEEACASAAAMGRHGGGTSCVGEDPALDQFMEAYCEMLSKYEQELSKPFKEAMVFLSRIESQFKSLSLSAPACGEAMERNGSSEEEVDVNNNSSFIDPQAEDRELKGQLLRKYSGYLGSLKQEFMKKRKKGKLPKEARQQLLDWWSRHYKWPYPSKLALAEATGLDQKQINNWFINQRKRHWKPSEDMQFVVMDAAHPHYYMDSVLGNPFPMDISQGLL